MYRSFRLATLTVLCALIPLVTFASERVVEKAFDVDPGVRLRLEAFKGEIHVETADVSTVQMTATIRPDEGPEEDLELVEIETSGSRSSVRIEVEYDRELTNQSSGWFGGSSSVSLPFVDFRIVMPDDGSLWLESHKSEFDIDAPSGEVEIESHKGEGKIRNVRGDFELDTHKGRFDIEIAELDDVRIETHKGDIDLRILGAEDFEVRGQTHKGSLRFRGHDVPVHEDDDDEAWVEYRSGRGSHLIELDTHKGSIAVSFE